MASPCNYQRLFLSATLCIVGCNEENIPPVSEAFLIGVTPSPDFGSTGVAVFSLLPKDSEGEAIIANSDEGLDIQLEVTSPANIQSEKTAENLNQPNPDRQLVAALNFDSSSSMGGNDPNQLRIEAGNQFLNQLGDNDMAGIFDFGVGSTDSFRYTRMLSNFTADKLQAQQALEQVLALGSTPMYESTSEVLTYVHTQWPATSANRSLILLGDGQPNRFVGGEEQVCSLAVDYNIPINTIGFGPAADLSDFFSGEAVRVLRKLASCSGGAYSAVANAEELSETFKNVGQATRSGSVDITIKFDPIPDENVEVAGNISLQSPGQDSPVILEFHFLAP